MNICVNMSGQLKNQACHLWQSCQRLQSGVKRDDSCGELLFQTEFATPDATRQNIISSSVVSFEVTARCADLYGFMIMMLTCEVFVCFKLLDTSNQY